jgi:para-aminobenzoate synthetase/4-amino-4-deoxychorismate lyase
MLDSADYFDFPVTKKQLEHYLAQVASRYKTPQRIRILLDPWGRLSHEATPHPAGIPSTALNVCLTETAVDSGDPFLYHKTTHRDVYNAARAECKGFGDVLLYNERGELTEFSLGNLVVEIEDRLFTPPIRCGVLPGTFRAHLLETGQVVEKAIAMERLRDCRRIFRINSVRRWQEVRLDGKRTTSSRK